VLSNKCTQLIETMLDAQILVLILNHRFPKGLYYRIARAKNEANSVL
jgi:hypothetical protein